MSRFKAGDRVNHVHNGMKGGVVVDGQVLTGVAGDTSAKVIRVVWERFGTCHENPEKLVVAP